MIGINNDLLSGNDQKHGYDTWNLLELLSITMTF